MEALTPAERRGALLVALLLALGAVHDLWRTSRPLPPPGSAAGTILGVAEHRTHQAPHGGPGQVLDTTGMSSGRGAAAPESPIDLNRASARELDALPGVGPVLAGRIVSHRAQQGSFRRREDLMAVRGIGPRLYARIAPHVTVGAPATAEPKR